MLGSFLKVDFKFVLLLKNLKKMLFCGEWSAECQTGLRKYKSLSCTLKLVSYVGPEIGSSLFWSFSN